MTVDPATDATITFKWSGFHNVYEMPSAAAMASNGVIHVISSVLMPPVIDEPTMGPTATEESDSAGRASLAVAAAAAIAYVV